MSVVVTALAALASVALAALLALAAYSTTATVAAAVALVALVTAVGWGVLLGLPDPRGTAVLVTVTGAAAAVVCLRTADRPRPLAAFAAVLALCVLAAFGHELLRRTRTDMVVSVTGTLSGQLLVLMGAGWILLRSLDARPGMTLVAAASVAVTRAGTAVSLPDPVDRFSGWVAFALGTVGGVVAAAVVGGVDAGRTVGIAAGVAAVTVGIDRLLGQQPTVRTPVGLLAAAASPVAAAGTIAYALAALIPG